MLGVVLAGCSSEKNVSSSVTTNNLLASADQFLTIHKSPTCGCCSDWISHMESRGFVTDVYNQSDISGIKISNGVTPELASCHTAITRNGLVIEGHVPGPLVEEFLADTPANAMGLSAPGMPIGSPGMEMGDSFQPYDVVVFFKDGSTSIYAEVTSPDQQYTVTR